MDTKVQCDICPRFCRIIRGAKGYCRARKNDGGKIVCDNYGKVTSVALDPIEKKPLRNFLPGSNVLSVGSYGCNFSCGFCQNNMISMCDEEDVQTVRTTPTNLADKALELVSQGNIGLAYTYNEPLIGYEFVLDCAKEIHDVNLKNVVVSNGYINEKPLRRILPYIDAANIDLKAFNNDFYRKIGGDLEDVKRSILLYSENCHLEITNLSIPDENDSILEMKKMCMWIASIDIDIPLHILRFFPTYKYSDRHMTAEKKIDELHEVASEYLNYVYKGN